MKFTDTIEAKSKKATRKEGTNRYGFKMTKMKESDGSDVWLNTIKKDIGEVLEQGDTVEFVCKETRWGLEIESAEKVIGSDEPAKTGIKTDSTQKSPPSQTKPTGKRWHAYEDPEWQKHVNDTIMKESAYGKAVEAFEKLPLKSSDDDIQTHAMSLLKMAHAIYFDMKENWEDTVPY